MKYNRLLLNTCFTSLLISNSYFASSNDTNKEPAKLPRLLQTEISATPIKRVDPRYPTEAAQIGAEGWVQVNIVINEEGNVTEADVVDSVGHRSLRKSTIKAIKRWKYVPAIIDGKPVEQCQTIQIDYQISNFAGVTKRFRTFYNKSMDLYNAKKYKELGEEVIDSKWDETSNMTELRWLNTLKATYYSAIGDYDAQLNSLKIATSKPRSANALFKLPKETVVNNLMSIFALEYTLKKYKDAIETFNSLQFVNADNTQETIAKLTPYYDEIIRTVGGEQPIFLDAKVNDKGVFSHRLVRNAFQITDIEDGELANIDIRCSRKRSRFTIEDNSLWSIPESWGQCNVYVNGDENTRFKLVEVQS
jgi:TonB family protein